MASTTALSNQPNLNKAIHENHAGSRAKYDTIGTAVTARTLTAEESGTAFFVEEAAATCTITLPAASGNAGVNFQFYVSAVAGAADTAIVAGDANTMNGLIVCADDTAANIGVAITAADQVLLDQTAGPAIGDRLDVLCDGTSWHCQGYSTATVAWVPSG